MHATFEDVEIGDSLSFGEYEVTREEIRTFARQYDPQPFHLGPDHEGPFDGLVASGWHTAAMTMRLLVDNYLSESGAGGSPGLDGLRWPAPVEPGDVLSVTLTVTSTDGWDESYGVANLETETTTADGTTVLWMDALTLYRRADGG
ncbi:MAG: MaoC/PaaZ C-terminal domain-containing protein [Halovenus sp.]